MPLPLAVQLYSFRDPARFGGAGMGLDPVQLEAIAAAGYLGVESVDVPGGDPIEARRVLADTGLILASAHSWAAPSDRDAFERACAALAEIGSPTIIVSANRFGSVAEIEALAGDLGAATEIAEAYGLRFGYHNHDTEFRMVDGVVAMDRLLALVDPAMAVQVDCYWVTVGGADPAAVISKLGERVVSLHVKDGVDLPTTVWGDEDYVNVPALEGTVRLPAAIHAAESLPSVDWLIVEFDRVHGQAIDASRQSAERLVEAGLARGRTR